MAVGCFSMQAFLAPKQQPFVAVLGAHCGGAGAGWHVHASAGLGATSSNAGMPIKGGHEFKSGSIWFLAALPHLRHSHVGHAVVPTDMPLMWHEHSPPLGHGVLW